MILPMTCKREVNDSSYDLQGRKTKAKGISIRDGKKVVKK